VRLLERIRPTDSRGAAEIRRIGDGSAGRVLDRGDGEEEMHREAPSVLIETGD